jgi:hypothetical protein
MIKSPGWGVEYVVTTGDNMYGQINVGHSDWESIVGRRYGEFILGRSDDRYPLQTSATQRFFPTVGNHDGTSSGTGQTGESGGIIPGYIDYFHTDPGGAGRLPAGVHTIDESYYDVELPLHGGGSVHIFAVDSDHARVDPTSRASEQAWLEAGLSASTATWKFVVFHHAAYSSSSTHGSEPAMQWDFAAWGADAVFTGHDHTYERIINPSDGLLYFVSGLGGRSIYGLGSPVAGSQVAYNDTFGAMRVTVDSQTATFESYSIDDGADGGNGGRLIDSYALAKEGTESDYYRVEARAGDVLTVETRVPAGGSGQFENRLDLAVELYSPDGTLLASTPGGSLAHTAFADGAYTVHVLPGNDASGEYVLHVGYTLPGDINGDETIDNDDATALALALRNPTAFEALFGSSGLLRADMDQDGDVDFDDIDDFVAVLNSQSSRSAVQSDHGSQNLTDTGLASHTATEIHGGSANEALSEQKLESIWSDKVEWHSGHRRSGPLE